MYENVYSLHNKQKLIISKVTSIYVQHPIFEYAILDIFFEIAVP